MSEQSEVQWSEPFRLKAGDLRPEKYQFRCLSVGLTWTDGKSAGWPTPDNDASLNDYRIPIIAEHPPYPVTVPYLPYIVTKCGRQIADLRANHFGDDDTHEKRAEALKSELHAAIRDCADRITKAMEEVGS